MRKVRVLRLQKSEPSVKIRFRFWGFSLVFSGNIGLKRDRFTRPASMLGMRSRISLDPQVRTRPIFDSRNLNQPVLSSTINAYCFTQISESRWKISTILTKSMTAERVFIEFDKIYLMQWVNHCNRITMTRNALRRMRIPIVSAVHTTELSTDRNHYTRHDCPETLRSLK